MMRFTRFALISGLCLLGSAFCAEAAPSYEVEYTNETPLVIIRFNQPHVMYEQPLYRAVARALEVKPSAMFDVVSISAKSRDPKEQKRNNLIASQDTRKVLATLRDMGLPQSRIHISTASDVVDASEVRVFVR